MKPLSHYTTLRNPPQSGPARTFATLPLTRVLLHDLLTLLTATDGDHFERIRAGKGYTFDIKASHPELVSMVSQALGYTPPVVPAPNPQGPNYAYLKGTYLTGRGD